SQINGDCRRSEPTVDQPLNLRRNSTRRQRKVSCCWFVLKACSDCASQFLEMCLNRIVQTVVACIVSPQWNDRLNSIMLHQFDDRLSFEGVVLAKTKDVITGDRERRSGTALADYETVVRVRVRLDHPDLGARLRSDDDFHAALVEVLDRFERLRGILLSVANKKLEPISAVLADRFCFELLFGNL